MADEPRPYAFSVERKPGYLHVRVSGENSPEVVGRYWGDMLEACRTLGANRALVEEDLAGPSLRQMQMFEIIDVLGGGPPPAVAFAYVDVNPEHDRDRLEFAETVARNRGFLFHLFRTVREAEEWLASL